MRLVDVKKIQAHPLKEFGVPLDFVHLSSGADPAKFLDLLNLVSLHSLTKTHPVMCSEVFKMFLTVQKIQQQGEESSEEETEIVQANLKS